MKAIRDNVDSTEVTIDYNDVLGNGTFRVAYRGTYTNGRRKSQLAACKRFHHHHGTENFETEMYALDFQVVNQSILYAQQWNDMCISKDCIQFNKGDIVIKDGMKFLFEPLIPSFLKYTSNNGWILKDTSKRISVECLEAFCHYTYHISDRTMIVSDLQGIYKVNRFVFFKSRYMLTDPAICSTRRLFGPSDMGQKGIDSFFANHVCNKFCKQYGKGKWKRPPRNTICWFDTSNDTNGHTSMMSSSDTYLLMTNNRTKFNASLQPIYE